MEQKLVEEVNELKQRVVMLEKIVTSLIEIEEVSSKNLTKKERKELERTLKYVKEGRADKFMSLEELRRRVSLS
jgi:DNA invertase Pin-like site-specific DNA recombinase